MSIQNSGRIIKPDFQALAPVDIKDEVEDIDQDTNKADLESCLAKALIEANDDIVEPDAVVSLTMENISTHLFTKQSISGIIGKAKGGKTTLTALLVVSVLLGYLGYGELNLTSQADGIVLFFDTEQGRYYGSLTLARIKKIAEGKIERLKYYDLREYSPNMRIDLIKHALGQHENIALVVIDGGRDIIYDINSPEQAINTITELMSLSVIHNTHITVILHQNKGDMNARGHFGTELVNKSETVISVNKSNDNANVSVVEAEFTRGLSFEPFSIARDESGAPFLQSYSPQESKGKVKVKMPTEMANIEVFAIVGAAFENASSDGYTYKELYTELSTAIQSVVGIRPTKPDIEQWIPLLKNRGFIIHNGEKTTRARYTQGTDLNLPSNSQGKFSG